MKKLIDAGSKLTVCWLNIESCRSSILLVHSPSLSLTMGRLTTLRQRLEAMNKNRHNIALNWHNNYELLL